MKNSFFRLLVCLIIISLLDACASYKAQDKSTPSWMIPSKRNLQYPAGKYYTIVEEREATKETMESVKTALQQDLEERLISQICTKVSMSITSTDFQTESDKISFVSSSIKETNNSSSAILFEKQKEFYFDKKNDKLFGFIYVKKDNLINGYKNTISLKINLLNNKINQYSNVENVDGYALISQFNSEIKAIELLLEVYYIILGNTDDDFVSGKFKDLQGDFVQFKSRFKDNTAFIDRVINEADEMRQNGVAFDRIIKKLNDALIYGPTNSKLLDKIAFYKEEWAAKLLSELTKHQANQEYKEAIALADKLAAVDQKKAQVYRLRKEELITEYFNATINKVSKLLDSGALTDGVRLLDEIKDYSYVDARRYNAIKARVDTIAVDIEVKKIENLIYEKDYYGAQNVCRENLGKYPNTKRLLNLQETTLEKITLLKKKEMLVKRATRYIFEFNYSVSHFPELMYGPDLADNEKFDLKRINFSQKLNYFQGGIYRKIFIKENEFGTPDKPKFSYSQIGVRAGYLDFSNYEDPDGGNFKDSKLTQIELSAIFGRFLMFNVGYLHVPNFDNTSTTNKEDYWCSTMGIRVPISFIHLTADATAFTQDYQKIWIYTKLGISVNIGFSKRFNQSDKKYLENEVSRLRND